MYVILAVCGMPFDTAEGYMDDGSDSYKSFVIDKDDQVRILWEYPKEKYGGYTKFGEIIGKFDPDTFFLNQPVGMEELTYKGMNKIYFLNYI